MNDMRLTCARREFLRRGAILAACGPYALGRALGAEPGVSSGAPVPGPRAGEGRVAIVACRSYGTELGPAMDRAMDLLGGVGSLVRGKTVTIKLNLTGTAFGPCLGRPAGETYTTHFATAQALGKALFDAGARRVRFVESTQSRESLERTLQRGGWDLESLRSLGMVEFENTRNLGRGSQYATLKVPGGGLFFSAFHLNHAYEETDVFVSLGKLKNHVTAGVTLSMKNLFGITPNSLYGEQAGREDATEGRTPLHYSSAAWEGKSFDHVQLPDTRQKKADQPSDAGVRVPRIITDLCAARPIHLAVIDGITAISGGEGWWSGDHQSLKLTSPGVIIAGLNPVATDAVGAAVMGISNPRAARGQAPFDHCENHILLAEQAGLGIADLSKLDVRGLALGKAIYPYAAGQRQTRKRIQAEPE